jgi:hypothetical protein
MGEGDLVLDERILDFRFWILDLKRELGISHWAWGIGHWALGIGNKR